MVRQPHYIRALLALTALLAAAACGDSAPTSVKHPQAPSSVIFDGAHSGNHSVFFLPPLVANPVNQPGYGGTPQSGLPVQFRIVCVGCGTNGANTTVTTFTPQFATDHYEANWDTKAQQLDPNLTYRIEVRVGSQALAFADVDVVSSGSQLKRVDTQEYIALLDGRTLPIKVRIQQGVTFCTGVNCASEIVPPSTPPDQPFLVETSDNLNGAAFRGHWNQSNSPVIVTIQDITSQVSNGKTGCNLGLANVHLTREHCVRISADPPVIVADDPAVDALGQNTVVVNTCIQNAGDERQLLLKYDINEAPIFLRDAPPTIACPVGFSSITPSRNPLVRFASSIGSFLSTVFGPKTAYAIDLGVGGALDAGSGFSVFALSFPANLTKVAGDAQSTTAATAVAIDPQVQLLAAHVHEAIEVAEDGNPAAVVGATVTCTVTGGGGTINGASSATVTTNAQGIATCPHWVLGLGQNTLAVAAPGLASNFFSLGNGEEPAQLSNSTTFAATGTQLVTGITSLQVSSPLEIDGALGNYSAIIANAGNISLSPNVALQGYVVQGTVKHAAGGITVLCGDIARGILPPGQCPMTFSVNASNSHGEPGTLVPGSAQFELDLIDGSGNVLASTFANVTLVNPPVIGN